MPLRIGLKPLNFFIMSISNKSLETVKLTAEFKNTKTNKALELFNIKHGEDVLYESSWFPNWMILTSKIISKTEESAVIAFTVDAQKLDEKMSKDEEWAKANPRRTNYDTSAFDQFSTKFATKYDFKARAERIASFRDDELQ